MGGISGAWQLKGLAAEIPNDAISAIGDSLALSIQTDDYDKLTCT
jgi:hypothetical protein